MADLDVNKVMRELEGSTPSEGYREHLQTIMNKSGISAVFIQL